MKPIKIAFRVDASDLIGSGHVMRCLALAEELRYYGASILFVSRELAGNLCGIIERNNFQVYRLPYVRVDTDKQNGKTDYQCWLGVFWEVDAEQTREILKNEFGVIDWLIIDHYALDERWENFLRSCAKKIMVIDDLADRAHNCDLLLDQNFYKNANSRYTGLIPISCQKLLGPWYSLLRREFFLARKRLRKRSDIIKRIFVFFGGLDQTNETEKTIKAIYLLNRSDILVDVVVGQTNQNKEKYKQLCKEIACINYSCQVNNMAEMMANADIAVGAGGITTWERCCLGLPSLVITGVDNQIQPLRELADSNVLHFMGTGNDISANDIAGELQHFFINPDYLVHYSSRSMELVDGLGANRCSQALLSVYKI